MSQDAGKRPPKRSSPAASSSLSPEPQEPPQPTAKARRASARQVKQQAAAAADPPPPSPPPPKPAPPTAPARSALPTLAPAPVALKAASKTMPAAKRKEPPAVERPKREKTTHACTACRRAKDKCNGTPPANGVGTAEQACKRCEKRGDVCDFQPLVKRGMSKSNPLRAYREMMESQAESGTDPDDALGSSRATTSPPRFVRARVE